MNARVTVSFDLLDVVDDQELAQSGLSFAELVTKYVIEEDLFSVAVDAGNVIKVERIEDKDGPAN